MTSQTDAVSASIRRLELAERLYGALVLSPCGCCCRWDAGKQTITLLCSRCSALTAWENEHALPSCGKLCDTLELISNAKP